MTGPERVINVNSTTVMWDVPVITNWSILVNWPDTVLHDKKEKTCPVIDIVTPDASNVNTKETEKLSRYKNLEIEVSRMWKVRTKFVPVMIKSIRNNRVGIRSEPSVAPRSPVSHRPTENHTDQNLQLLPGHLSATDLQKITQIRTFSCSQVTCQPQTYRRSH